MFTRRTRLVRAEPDCSEALDQFWRRLAETITWCKAHLDPTDPRGCLRPASFRPRVLERDYFSAVASVAALREREARAAVASQFIHGGRLLLYFPDAELADGAAEAESNGFFDVHNAPPHATWVGIFRDDAPQDDSYAVYLLAWVPPAFVNQAQRGIDANPEKCIAWLTDRNVALRAVLPELQTE